MRTLIRLLAVVTGLVLAMLVAVPAAMAQPVVPAGCAEARAVLSTLLQNAPPAVVAAAQARVAEACAPREEPPKDNPRDDDKDKCKDNHNGDWDRNNDKCDHHDKDKHKHHDKDKHDDKDKVYTQVKSVPVGPVDTGGGPA